MRRGFLVRLVLCLLLFAVSFGVTFGSLRARDRRREETARVAAEMQQQDAARQTPPTPETAQTLAAGHTAPQDAPPEGLLVPPYHEEKAPDTYFRDAIFIGNSLIEGLGLYAWMYDENINQATFETGTNMTVFTPEAWDAFDEAAAGDYGKVYIGLGLNEIDYEHDAIREHNEEIIDTIREGNPDAIIYLFSLTPMSEHRCLTDELYNNENAAAISDIIRSVAEEKGCYYIDMVPVLAGDDGYLPADVTSDGIHCVKEYYPHWYDYLEHNYVLA